MGCLSELCFEIWVFDGVDFDIWCGEVFGLIGLNGVGKSMLLKVLSCIMELMEGCVEIYGCVGILFEVGIGFYLEFIGCENIFFSGVILGMWCCEFVENYDVIVVFVEVEEFIDILVKYYLSGMYLCFVFVVVVYFEFEIFMVDEVFVVGDVVF